MRLHVLRFGKTIALSIALAVVFAPEFCESNNPSSNDKFTDLTSNEKRAIDKTKDLLGEKLLYRNYMKTDKYLVRWIRDADLNPSVAAERIRQFHEFRLQNNMDSIVSENWDDMERNFPFEIIDGLDTEGGASVGKWSIREQVLAGRGGAERFQRYIDYILEKCDIAIRNTIAVNGTGIFNMNGYSLKSTACLACIPKIIYFVTALEKNYPQMIKHFYMINTPRYFDPLLKILAPLLSPYTSKVYRIYGYDRSEWAPIVLDKIPADLLPVEYGGTRNHK